MTTSVSKTRSRANVGHVTRVQSVKIGTNRQHVHKAREGNVASGDTTSASMIRTRVGVGFVTRVPRIGMTLQHVSTKMPLTGQQRRESAVDGTTSPWVETANQDSKGFDSSPARVQDVDLELCVHLMTLQTGRSSTEGDLPHRHSEVLGGSPTQRSERRRINHFTEVVGHSTSTTDVS